MTVVIDNMLLQSLRQPFTRHLENVERAPAEGGAVKLLTRQTRFLPHRSDPEGIPGALLDAFLRKSPGLSVAIFAQECRPAVSPGNEPLC